VREAEQRFVRFLTTSAGRSILVMPAARSGRFMPYVYRCGCDGCGGGGVCGCCGCGCACACGGGGGQQQQLGPKFLFKIFWNQEEEEKEEEKRKTFSLVVAGDTPLF